MADAVQAWLAGTLSVEDVAELPIMYAAYLIDPKGKRKTQEALAYFAIMRLLQDARAPEYDEMRDCLLAELGRVNESDRSNALRHLGVYQSSDFVFPLPTDESMRMLAHCDQDAPMVRLARCLFRVTHAQTARRSTNWKWDAHPPLHSEELRAKARKAIRTEAKHEREHERERKRKRRDKRFVHMQQSSGKFAYFEAEELDHERDAMLYVKVDADNEGNPRYAPEMVVRSADGSDDYNELSSDSDSDQEQMPKSGVVFWVKEKVGRGKGGKGLGARKPEFRPATAEEIEQKSKQLYLKVDGEFEEFSNSDSDEGSSGTQMVKALGLRHAKKQRKEKPDIPKMPPAEVTVPSLPKGWSQRRWN